MVVSVREVRLVLVTFIFFLLVDFFCKIACFCIRVALVDAFLCLLLVVEGVPLWDNLLAFEPPPVMDVFIDDEFLLL